jgi:cytochrome c peroxidase
MSTAGQLVRGAERRGVIGLLMLLTLAVGLSPTLVFGAPETEKDANKREVSHLPSSYTAAFAPLPVEIVPADAPLSSEIITLGRRLYHEQGLSRSRKISCNSCHDLNKFGVDNLSTSPGHLGKPGERNSPSTLNAAVHVAQFWDGRASTVEEQAIGPILNPGEMAMASEDAVLSFLRGSAKYRKLFVLAFGKSQDPITIQNVKRAIGAFERTLLTPSRFDSYLRGNTESLSANEEAGLKMFVDTGCATCHQGVGIGGGMYMKLGLVKPYETKDKGRFVVTKNESDLFVFKVPSLRNVTETFPYFHDGSIKTLKDAVILMGRHQLGKELSDGDVESIISFLGALKGELPNKD